MSTTGTDGNEKTLEDDLNLLFYGPPGTGKTFVAEKLAEKFVSSHNFPANQDDELVDEERLVQPPDVGTMSDAEYEQYVRTEIQREAVAEGFTWTEKKRDHNYILEKDEKEIRLVITYSGSSTEEPEECWVGVKGERLNFLSQGDELNRYIVIVNDSTKNFVVLPFLVEQSEANHGSPDQANWTGTAQSDHHFKININAEKASLVTASKNKDCTRYARNIRSMLFRQFIRKVTFHQSYSYEEFVEGIRPNLDSGELSYKLEDGFFKKISHAAKSDPKNKYVLLIDEINRGNIPKIFGELITLIEDEKREEYDKITGERIPGGYSLNLSVSQERFSVPKNLYIIGTMNTADQSISQLDIALRRRFSHKELMPIPELLKIVKHELTTEVEGKPIGTTIEISLKSILVNINKKILKMAGREKQIGHAYFMRKGESVSDTNGGISLLRDKFENKIIPLIQEYFYEDMNSVHDILGDGFIDKDKQEVVTDNLKHLDKFAVACEKLA